MAPRPSNFEQPPGGLHDPWLTAWKAALAALKAQGGWTHAVRPLLDEYVWALRRAAQLAERFDRDPERTGLLVAIDRESRRARGYAHQLGLSPTAAAVVARRADAKGPVHELADNASVADRFIELDELAPRRDQRAQAS